MTTAARFVSAWHRGGDAVELLPDRLARAIAEVLGAAGAGLSLLTESGFRVPLGASDPAARAAERLQFTHGTGPCLAAAGAALIVHASQARFERDWPVFYADLLAMTPYRSVVAVPIRFGPNAVGAYDVYLRDPDGGVAISDTDLQIVRVEIVAALAGAVSRSGTPEGSAWLERPAARRRTDVWIAIGVLSGGLGLPAVDALDLLRAYAYAHDLVLDDVAQALVARELTAADLRA